MSIKQLCLVPTDAEQTPTDLRDLLVKLREIGFMGDEYDFYGEIRYRPGQDFHELIQFYGSHPIIQLDFVNGELAPVGAIDSRNDCSIAFDEVGLTPEFLGGPCTLAPLCPQCGYEEEEWPDMLSDWYPQKSEHKWVCPKCRDTLRVYDLDWGYGAAMGRFRVIIDRVAYGEAAPTQRLLDELSEITGFPWRYFYYDDNPTDWRGDPEEEQPL